MKRGDPSEDSAPTVEPPTLPRIAAAGEDLSSSHLETDASISVEPATERDVIGKLVSDRYRIDALIGRGGMGAVYRGEQVHLRKRVAIKLLSPDAERLPELVARFEREAIAGAHISHPNVAAAFDFGRLQDDSYFLVLEYVEGSPLTDAMTGPMPAMRTLRIARQIASALVAVHTKGIVHRDVKPQNVLIDATDRVKLIDFGLAKIRLDLLSPDARARSKPDAPITAAGVLFGTIAYIAPEASLGMDAVDARGDLYALGVVMYEMLTGLRPFDATEVVALFALQRLNDPPGFAERAPDVAVPPEVEAVVMKLIQRDPAARYGTAIEALDAIDAALASLEAAAKRRQNAPLAQTAAVTAIPKGRSGLPPWIFAAVGGGSLVLGCLGVLAVWALGSEGEPEPTPSATATNEASPSAAPVPTASGATQPEPSASVTAAEVGPSARPTEVDGFDSVAWRARMKKAAAIKSWMDGATALAALAKLDPESLNQPDTRAIAVVVVSGVAFEEGKKAAEIYDLLENGLGQTGLDILYDVAVSRGGTKGGKRAEQVLAKPSVRARATPALRVALELREAGCEKKRALLDRASADGDGRSLAQLQALRALKCTNKKDPCCFREDAGFAKTVKVITQRLTPPKR